MHASDRTYSGIRENCSRNTHATAAAMLQAEADVRRVLDIPCGYGAFAQRMHDQGLAAFAADCGPGIQTRDAPFAVCDMNAPLPYRSASLDAVACLDGIAHTERPFDFVRECARVLRPRGVLVISTPNISSLRSRWRWLWTGFHNKRKSPLDESLPAPRHIINLMSLDRLRYILHTNGFQIREIRTNRVKPASWLYGALVPVAWVWTRWVFRSEESDPGQRDRNREILRQMFSRPVLFGESLIVKAGRA